MAVYCSECGVSDNKRSVIEVGDQLLCSVCRGEQVHPHDEVQRIAAAGALAVPRFVILKGVVLDPTPGVPIGDRRRDV